MYGISEEFTVASTPATATLKSYSTVRNVDGQLNHRFDLLLSEPVWIKHPDMRRHAFTVTNGSIVRSKRVERTRLEYNGRNRIFSEHWRLDILPTDIDSDVTVSLKGVACGQQGGMCTQSGGGITNTPSLTMRVPGSTPTVWIEDATGDEDDGQIVFDIRFSKAVGNGVKLRFRTIPGGSATEGVDYYPADIEDLAIRRGTTTWQIGVGLRDDTENDNGETVKVQISDARLIDDYGDHVIGLDITDGEATGTISNSDPLPRAWLARFGRTVADQVLDAVAGRMGVASGFGALWGLARER